MRNFLVGMFVGSLLTSGFILGAVYADYLLEGR